MEKNLVICECGSSEHIIIFRYFKDDLAPEVYADIHLTKKGFFDRLIYGIKYIFGYQSKFGAFDEIILSQDHADNLQTIVNYLNKNDEEKTV